MAAHADGESVGVGFFIKQEGIMEKEEGTDGEGQPSGVEKSSATAVENPSIGFTEEELAGLSQEERDSLASELSDSLASKGDDKATDEGTEDQGKEKKPDPSQQSSSPKFKIKVSGKEREVEQSELIELAQKGDDYTQKSQRVARMLKEVQSDPLGFIKRNPEISKRFMEQYEAAQAPKPEDISIPDPGDPESVKKFHKTIESMVNAGVQRAMSSRSSLEETQRQIVTDLAAINKSRITDGLEELSQDEIKEIAAHGDASGISTFRAAYRDMNYDQDRERTRKMGAQKLIDKLNETRTKESQRLPTGGSGGGKSGKAMTESDLEKMDLTTLPDDDVDELLRQFG
jgi:hypothetical protein